jgi:hypothetical protein
MYVLEEYKALLFCPDERTTRSRPYTPLRSLKIEPNFGPVLKGSGSNFGSE